MTSFIDTHCHLDRLRIPEKEAVRIATEAGVVKFITIAVEANSLDIVCQSTEMQENIYASVGIHPHHANQYTEEIKEKIRDLVTNHPKVVAIGETGLDYHYMHSPKEVQQHAFQDQLQLAQQLNKPVVLHTREAEADTLQILHENPVPQQGVAHSFTGSQQMALELIEMKWMIGINGIITFKNAEDLRKIVRKLPLEQILLETDAPFLAPIPYRGKPNEPSRIPVIAQFLADLLEVPLAQLAEQTSQNARHLFQLPP